MLMRPSNCLSKGFCCSNQSSSSSRQTRWPIWVSCFSVKGPKPLWGSILSLHSASSFFSSSCSRFPFAAPKEEPCSKRSPGALWSKKEEKSCKFASCSASNNFHERPFLANWAWHVGQPVGQPAGQQNIGRPNGGPAGAPSGRLVEKMLVVGRL